MNFRNPAGGHLGLAILGGLAVFPLIDYFQIPLDLKESFYTALLVFLGALFPDLDTHSTPSKFTARIGVLAAIFFLYTNQPIVAAFIGLAFMLTKCGKHRGWTHSLLLPSFIYAAGYYSDNHIYGLAFSSGLMIHIISDYTYSYLKKKRNHF